MDLFTSFLGLTFENPFVLASAPPTANAEMLARAFEAGWAGAVIKTLIREPVQNLQNRFASIRAGKDIISFSNIELLSEQTPEQWYADIRKLKKMFPHKVLIGSIMGDAKSREQWIELALGCQEAGVDMLEANFSCPHGYPEKGKGAAIGQSAEYSAMITRWLKEEKRLTVPVIPKLTAAVTDITHIGEAVAEAGADGLCAINTYPSMMGFDLRTLQPKPSVAGYSTAGGYSGPGLKPIALRCVTDLVKSPGLPIMACGGISSGSDAVEFMLTGAPVVQICTAVMLHGYAIVHKMKDELVHFMEQHQFSAPSDFIGLANQRIGPYSGLNPDYAVKAHVDAGKCNGCRICHISCQDGGYQAIEMHKRLAVVQLEKCAGCSLCFQVCPEGAITMQES